MNPYNSYCWTRCPLCKILNIKWDLKEGSDFLGRCFTILQQRMLKGLCLGSNLVWQLQWCWEELGGKVPGMWALPFTRDRSKWYPDISACGRLPTRYQLTWERGSSGFAYPAFPFPTSTPAERFIWNKTALPRNLELHDSAIKNYFALWLELLTSRAAEPGNVSGSKDDERKNWTRIPGQEQNTSFPNINFPCICLKCRIWVFWHAEILRHVVSCEYMTSPLNATHELKVKCLLKGGLNQQLHYEAFQFWHCCEAAGSGSSPFCVCHGVTLSTVKIWTVT